MTNKVVKSLASKYENISKEVSNIMGGKVLEYEAKTILNQGKLLQLIELVEKGLLSIEVAAQEANMTLEEFKQSMLTKTNLR